jgi:hypothetical protein
MKSTPLRLKDNVITIVISRTYNNIKSFVSPRLETCNVTQDGFHFQNETWTLKELTPRKQPITSKWVYKNKVNVQCEVEKLKAQIVVKGLE